MSWDEKRTQILSRDIHSNEFGVGFLRSLGKEFYKNKYNIYIGIERYFLIIVVNNLI